MIRSRINLSEVHGLQFCFKRMQSVPSQRRLLYLCSLFRSPFWLLCMKPTAEKLAWVIGSKPKKHLGDDELGGKKMYELILEWWNEKLKIVDLVL